MFIEVILYFILSFGRFPPRLNFLCRRFGTHFHLHRPFKQEEFFSVSKRRHKIQTLGYHPKEWRQVTQYGENLKSRMIFYLLSRNYDKLCFGLLLLYIYLCMRLQMSPPPLFLISINSTYVCHWCQQHWPPACIHSKCTEYCLVQHTIVQGAVGCCCLVSSC
jgi:hypothetical protein